MDIFTLFTLYIIISLAFIALNFFVCGFTNVDPKFGDFSGGFIWPLTIFTLLGLICRTLMIKLKKPD